MALLLDFLILLFPFAVILFLFNLYGTMGEAESASPIVQSFCFAEQFPTDTNIFC